MSNDVIYDKEVVYKAGLIEQELPRKYQTVINELTRIHGKLVVGKKGNHVVLSMPSPEALRLDGAKEVYSRHLGVNLTLALDEGRDWCAKCNKYGKAFGLDDLLNMPTLEERNIQHVKRSTIYTGNSQSLEPDENGNMVPRSPGDVVPVNELPPEHPALEFLRYRGFTTRYDLNMLYEQFTTSFCWKENPKGYYGRLPHGFRKTPQNRLIFYMTINGVRRGWQTRILEKVENNVFFYYHPYTHEWVPVKYRANEKSPWIPIQGFENFKPSKYVIGAGTDRNGTLMGYDAARTTNTGAFIIVEGVLDAAKLGIPAIASQGKWFSDEQAKLLSNTLNPETGHRVFQKGYVIGDNDPSGSKLVEYTQAACVKQGIPITEIKLEGYEDPGEMPINEAREFVNHIIKQNG
jgi:hypothetical protein